MSSPAEFKHLPDMAVTNPSPKEARCVYVLPGEGVYAGAKYIYCAKRMDEEYHANPRAILDFLAGSTRRILDSTQPRRSRFSAAILYDHSATPKYYDEAMVVFSPLNDGEPLSSASEMERFISTPHPSRLMIEQIKPNSWSPIVKLHGGFYGLQDIVPMPVIQIYAPLPRGVLSQKEHFSVMYGDHRPFGRLAVAALAQLKSELGHPSIRRLHFFGAGMGQRAIGAAQYLYDNPKHDYEVASVTAMNLVLGKSLREIAATHAGQSTHLAASEIVPPEDALPIGESQLRKDTDGHGAELSMYWRQIKAMLRLRDMMGFRNGAPTIEAIRTLVQQGIPVRIANAVNGKMTSETLHHLPIGLDGVKYTAIVGVEGTKVGMASNEHARLVELMMGLGPRDTWQAH